MAASKWELTLVLGDMALFIIAIPLLLLGLARTGHWGVIPFSWDLALVLILALNLTVLYVSDLYDRYKDYRTLENISRLLFAVWLSMVLGILVLRAARPSLTAAFSNGTPSSLASYSWDGGFPFPPSPCPKGCAGGPFLSAPVMLGSD